MERHLQLWVHDAITLPDLLPCIMFSSVVDNVAAVATAAPAYRYTWMLVYAL